MDGSNLGKIGSINFYHNFFNLYCIYRGRMYKMKYTLQNLTYGNVMQNDHTEGMEEGKQAWKKRNNNERNEETMGRKSSYRIPLSTMIFDSPAKG